jgi:hypothetical protein
MKERTVLIQDSIDYLLAEACPSIKYRTRSEVLGESTSSDEMIWLQKAILEDKIVKAIMRAHKPNGWLGESFHGNRGSEAYIRLLREKGVESNHPVIMEALQALNGKDEDFARELLRVGRILDQKGLGGSNLIRAVIFAYAGREDAAFIKEQVDTSLRTFQSVTTRRSISDVAEQYKGKLVFKAGVHWPSIYHLRLLAFTSHWRTQPNQDMMHKSVGHLVKLSPIPYVLAREKSQLIAPAAVAMDEFDPDMPSLDSKGWAMWFLRMELLSRLGVVNSIPELRAQLKHLAELLADGGGKFTKNLSHSYFTKWTAYTGLALEKDWKSPARRMSDLTFRSLLILHHSKV